LPDPPYLHGDLIAISASSLGTFNFAPAMWSAAVGLLQTAVPNPKTLRRQLDQRVWQCRRPIIFLLPHRPPKNH
jgi:hypothetical protein